MSLPTHFPLKVAGGKTIEIPSVGFGTWASGDKSWCKDATLAALKAGYRHIDCAWMYGVDEQVGQAIRESGIPRSEIFVVSKFWPHFAAPENVEVCLDKILSGMGLEYLDCLIAHWPLAFKPVPGGLEKAAADKTAVEDQGMASDENGKSPVLDWEHTSAPIAEAAGQKGSWVPTWQALQKLVATGKVKAVGVSNFSIADLKEILPYAKDVPIACNQVEVHPWLPQTELIEFMKQHDILCTCYSPFAGQKDDGKTLLKDAKVLDVAKKNDMDVGQLLQSWAVQRGTSPLGKSQTECKYSHRLTNADLSCAETSVQLLTTLIARIKTNLAIRKLSQEDIKALDLLAQSGDSGRTVNPRPKWGVERMFVN